MISDDRIDRKIILYLLAITLMAGIMGGALSGKVLRTETRVENVTKVTEVTRVAKKVQRVETVEYKPVKLVDAPPLDDPKKACHGAPVRIVKMHIGATDNGKGDQPVTWLTVMPVGDAYTVTCQIEGDYGVLWSPGMVIRLYDAIVQGEA